MVKWAKWLIGGTVTAGAIAAITVPITLSVKNKKVAVTPLNLDEIGFEKIDGTSITLKELKEKTTVKLNASSSLVSDFTDAATYFYYDLEQKASIGVQKADLELKVTNLYLDKADLDKPASTLTTGEKDTRRNNIDAQITDIRNKIKIFESTSPIKLDYYSTNFKSDYPMILTPASKMVKDNVKALSEEKEQHIRMFNTRTKGIADWHKLLINKYKSATTKEVAKARTLKIMKAIALRSFTVTIMSKTIKEMKKVQYDPSGDATKKLIYPYFKDVVTQAELARSKANPFEDTDSIYYLGTKSFIKNRQVISYQGCNTKNTTPEGTNLNLKENNKFRKDIIERLTNQGIADFKHAIIPFVPNQENNANRWSLKPLKKTKNTVEDKRKTLLSMFERTDGLNMNFDKISQLFVEDKPNETINLKATNLYLKTVNEGGNAASKGGTMNVGPLMKFLSDSAKTYDKEFIMGSLLALASTKGNNKISASVFGEGDKLIDRIKDAVLNIYKDLNLSTLKTTATLKTALDGIKEEDIDRFVGQEIKKAISDVKATAKDGSLKHIYKLGKNSKGGKRFIIISNFGIHIITWQDFSDPDVIKVQMESDFKKMNDKQSTTKIKLPYNTLFTGIFTDVSKIKYINGKIDNKATLDGVTDSSSFSNFIKWLKKQDELPIDSDDRWYKKQKNSTGKESIDVIEAAIEIQKQNKEHIDLEKMNMVTKIFTQEFVNGILSQYDKQLRDPTEAKISDLFAATLKAAGVRGK